jgi:hypothetical protein
VSLVSARVLADFFLVLFDNRVLIFRVKS